MGGGKNTRGAKVCRLLREAFVAHPAAPRWLYLGWSVRRSLLGWVPGEQEHALQCPGLLSWKGPSDSNRGTEDAGSGSGSTQSLEVEESGENVKALKES